MRCSSALLFQVRLSRRSCLKFIKIRSSNLCEKSCKKPVQERKEMEKKKDSLHDETSADVDAEEASTKRQLPNYFIAIQVRNPEVHERLRAVQEEIVSSNEQLRAALVPLATLHLTFMVMRLSDSDDQLNRAKMALDICGEKLRNDLSTGQLDFNVQGLGNFRNKVIFAKVENGPILDQLSHIAETVTSTFADECGLLPVDTKGFKPHLTIMKLSRARKLWNKGIRKIEPALYERHTETTFGRDSLHHIQLCSISKPKDEKGYYQVPHSVSICSYSSTATPPGGGVRPCGNTDTPCGSGSGHSQ
ncbi:A-kinase anchor protein 7 [Lamellibrachia satsuma]|nr:A-kinase anchor protein 7 [Lamellibrachia satsuma]